MNLLESAFPPEAFAVVAGISVAGGLAFRWSLRNALRRDPPAAGLAPFFAVLGLAAIAGMSLARGCAHAAAVQCGLDSTGESAVSYALFAGIVALLADQVRRRSRGEDPAGMSWVRIGPGILLGVSAYALVLPVVLAANWLNNGLVNPEDGAAHVQKTLGFVKAAEGVWPMFVFILGVVVVGPLLEELVYRGLLLSAFRAALGTTVSPRAAAVLSILLSAIIFTVLHEWFVYVPVFVLGIVLGTIYDRTRNLFVAVAFHATHNLVTVVLARSGWVT